MDWVDWLILGIVAASTLFGLFKGFTHEVMSLAGWIVAFIVAKFLMKKMFVLLSSWIENETLRWVLAWFIPFIIVILISVMIRYLLSEFVATAGLSGMDLMLGGLFGFLRGTLIISVIVLFLRLTLFTDQAPIRQQSVLLPYFNHFIYLFIDPVSDFFTQKIEQLRQQVKQMNAQGESPEPLKLMKSMGWDKQGLDYLKKHPEVIESILKELDGNPKLKREWQDKLSKG